MNTCLNENDRSGRRGGFTVVEILVAITVIAILSAMLIPVVGSAMRRANEFAIESEMAQLDLAVEHFKSDNGFYPPSFARLSGASDFMPYLNRIAPNHGYTQQQVIDWCNTVGAEIGGTEGADLVFWLSGIAKNKQFPLGLPGNWIAGHGAAGDDVERNAYFDFSTDRLNINGTAASYTQARGKQFDFGGAPAVYRYLDSGSYGRVPSGYCLAGALDLTNRENFFNKDSFQLVAPGLDGDIGKKPDPNQNPPQGLMVTDFLEPNQPSGRNQAGLDNIVNFVGEGSGRLETKALGID